MAIMTSWDLFDDPHDVLGVPAAGICEGTDADLSVELPGAGTGHREITFQDPRRRHA